MAAEAAGGLLRNENRLRGLRFTAPREASGMRAHQKPKQKKTVAAGKGDILPKLRGNLQS